MTIEQMVEIHDDHRLVLDLPREIPVGRVRAAITFFFEAAPAQEQSCLEPWVNPLFGLAKDSTLTLDRFLEMQREDAERENEQDRRLWGEKW